MAQYKCTADYVGERKEFKVSAKSAQDAAEKMIEKIEMQEGSSTPYVGGGFGSVVVVVEAQDGTVSSYKVSGEFDRGFSYYSDPTR